MAGIGGADSNSGGGASSSAGSNSNSSGGAGKNDSSKNDKSSKNSGSGKSESKGSKGSDKGSFDRAMNDAQNKTDGGNDKNKSEANQQADKATPNKSTSPSAHASELSGLSSLNSHRGYGPDEQPAPNPDQKAKTETKTIDVQGKLDKLDRQLTQQKAHEERSFMSSLVPDTHPDACTVEHPTGQKSVPFSNSVVYSGDPASKPALQGSPEEHPADTTENQYNFATPAAATVTIADGLITGSTKFVDKMPDNIGNSLKTISKYTGPGGRLFGSGAETLEAVMNAKPEDRARAGITGFVASLDDFAVAAGGAKAGAWGGPLGSAAVATTASLAYDNSKFDKAFDGAVYDVADKIEKDGLAKTVGDGLTAVATSVDDAIVGTAGTAAGFLGPLGPVETGRALSRDYENSAIDKAFDKGVHATAEKIGDGLEFVADSAKEGLGYVADQVSQGLDYVTDNFDQFEQDIRDQALNQTKREAHRR